MRLEIPCARGVMGQLRMLRERVAWKVMIRVLYLLLNIIRGGQA